MVDVDQFGRRLIGEALLTATRVHWQRRADTFAAAAEPRRGEFLGKAGAAGAERVRARLRAKEAACRRRAALCEYDDVDARLIAYVWTEGFR